DSERRAAVARLPRVLVLSPTRELAAQIGESFQTYGRYLKFRQAVVFGGVNQHAQVRALNRGVQIVIATPGRLLDLMQQGHVNLHGLETFVLDEADRMLDLGFLPDLKRIVAQLPRQRHSLFFSATLPPRVAQLAAGLLTNPVRVEVSPQSATVERIAQRVLFVQQADKRELLQRLLKTSEIDRALIFTRTKRGADRVARQLNQSGQRADAIHGNKSQNARTRTLGEFRRGRVRLLVATDLAARGIDVDGITHVINYDLPLEPESYVHRIGRTGRAGAEGVAVSFCDAKEHACLRAIEKLIQRTIRVEVDHPFHVPTPATPASRPAKVRRGPRPRRGKPARVRL
nr:DEAD/DEAH box helicase [Planctomycetales bacterium]NIM09199.1 DEAD/DEAH box helicase [Planctomycetales bacterium]NIN09732.1 DEAD/DEAH box helicase [Planctomycetales bacterium]NIN78857.1 DEAD/DEAH box helicase [Planctomycetales bacterium]NIO36024.1 DEAD/DEAH box helicase [Planctomycetales bacterium]